MIKIIAAVSSNNIIGKTKSDGTQIIPWHYKEDFAFFRRMTTGCPIIMGRKTFQSIGKPLPKRRNIVVSRAGFSFEGVEPADSLTSALNLVDLNDTVWLIGGASIYQEGLSIADELYLTSVPETVLADNGEVLVSFPAIPDAFEITEKIPLEGTSLIVNKYTRKFVKT